MQRGVNRNPSEVKLGGEIIEKRCRLKANPTNKDHDDDDIRNLLSNSESV